MMIYDGVVNETERASNLQTLENTQFVTNEMTSANVTVYQRTPDIAISEVKECLRGQRTRSVFLDLLFVFCDL